MKRTVIACALSLLAATSLWAQGTPAAPTPPPLPDAAAAREAGWAHTLDEVELAMKLHQPGRAIERLEAWIRSDPRSVYALRAMALIAQIQIEQGRFDEATKLLGRVRASWETPPNARGPHDPPPPNDAALVAQVQRLTLVVEVAREARTLLVKALRARMEAHALAREAEKAEAKLGLLHENRPGEEIERHLAEIHQRYAREIQALEDELRRHETGHPAAGGAPPRPDFSEEIARLLRARGMSEEAAHAEARQRVDAYENARAAFEAIKREWDRVAAAAAGRRPTPEEVHERMREIQAAKRLYEEARRALREAESDRIEVEGEVEHRSRPMNLEEVAARLADLQAQIRHAQHERRAADVERLAAEIRLLEQHAARLQDDLDVSRRMELDRERRRMALRDEIARLHAELDRARQERREEEVRRIQTEIHRALSALEKANAERGRAARTDAEGRFPARGEDVGRRQDRLETRMGRMESQLEEIRALLRKLVEDR